MFSVCFKLVIIGVQAGGTRGLNPNPPELWKFCIFSNKTLMNQATTLKRKHNKIILLA